MRPQMRRQTADGRSQKSLLFLVFLPLFLHLSPSPTVSLLRPVTAQTTQDRKLEADRLLQQGIQQIQNNQLQTALQSLEQALTLYRQLNHRSGEGVALIGLGETNLRLGNSAKALALSQQALAIARELNNAEMEKFARQVLQAAQIADNPQKREADRLLQQGTQQIQNNQLQAALQSLEQALTIYRQLNHRAGEGAALIGLGETNLRLGNPAKALELSQQAIAIAKELNNPEIEKLAQQVLDAALKTIGNSTQIPFQKMEADRLLEQGNQQFQISQFEMAIQAWQQALAIYRAIQDRQGEGATLGNLGAAYFSLGKYVKAIEYHEKSLAISRGIENRQGEGSSLGNLGHAYQLLGDYRKAIKYYEQSLAIAQEIKNRQREGQSLGSLGEVYRNLGDYAKAIEYQQQWLAIARELKDRQGEGSALSNSGNAYFLLGNYAKAIEYYQQSLTITRELKDRQGEGATLGNLGNPHLSLGNYAKAIEYYQQSLTITREIKDRQGEGATLGRLGGVYYALGNHSKAIDYQEKSLTITREIKDRKGEGSALGNLGNAYLSLNNYDKAIGYLEQQLAIAREIKDRQGEGQSLINLGGVYFAMGNHGKAIEFYQQGLIIAREIKYRDAEGSALNNLGVSLFKSGQVEAAARTLLDSITVRESVRETGSRNDADKVSIFETQSITYSTLQKVLIAQNKPNAALEIAERGRARAFVELLAQRLKDQESTSLIPQVQASMTLKEVKPLNLQQIQQIAQAQNATLVQYSILFDDFKIQNKQETRQSELYVWVIPPTGDISFRKVDLRPLWEQQNINLLELVVQSREVIGARGRADVEVALSPEFLKRQQDKQTRNLKQLHQLLIEPIAPLLPQDPTQRVIFMPQGELFLVPFPALLDANGKALIEQHTILTAPSIQVLELTRQQRDRLTTRKSVAGKSLIVGNPTMPKVVTQLGDTAVQLSDLPGAKREALEIAKLLNTQAITGQQATETAIAQQMPMARLIHFATHGLLDDVKGLGVPGAIALAPAGNGQLNDGLLTADEILDMKLNAELVVLSACDTGRGRITGDGVIGLSRSLITAGVPSIIVSLWKVPDDSTAFLMTEFYQNLQKTPDKAQALRQAMLTTKQKYPAPLNWAAFTLIGEAE